MYLDRSPIPVEVTPEMVDFYNQQTQQPVVTGPKPYLVDVPGTDMQVDINPATSEVLNIVGLIGLGLITLYLMKDME